MRDELLICPEAFQTAVKGCDKTWMRLETSSCWTSDREKGLRITQNSWITFAAKIIYLFQLYYQYCVQYSLLISKWQSYIWNRWTSQQQKLYLQIEIHIKCPTAAMLTEYHLFLFGYVMHCQNFYMCITCYDTHFSARWKPRHCVTIYLCKLTVPKWRLGHKLYIKTWHDSIKNEKSK